MATATQVSEVQRAHDKLEDINTYIYGVRRIIECMEDNGPGSFARDMRLKMSQDIAAVEEQIETIIRQLHRFSTSGRIDRE